MTFKDQILSAIIINILILTTNIVEARPTTQESLTNKTCEIHKTCMSMNSNFLYETENFSNCKYEVCLI